MLSTESVIEMMALLLVEKGADLSDEREVIRMLRDDHWSYDLIITCSDRAVVLARKLSGTG